MAFAGFSVGIGSPQLIVDAQRVWSGQVSYDRRARHLPPLPPTPDQPTASPLPASLPAALANGPGSPREAESESGLAGSRSLMNESPLASPEHVSGRRQPSYASFSSRRSSRPDIHMAIPKSHSSLSLQLGHCRSSSSSLVHPASSHSGRDSPSSHRRTPSANPDMGRNHDSPDVPRQSMNPSPLSTLPMREKAEPPSYSRRATPGADLDNRIRSAEDRIRIVHRERARPNAYPLSHDRMSPEKRAWDATLTVADPLANGKDTPPRNTTASASSSGGDRSFERNAGRRRPLPAQFRQSLFSPPDYSPTRYRGSMDNLDRVSSAQWSSESRLREEPVRRSDFRQTPEQPTPSKDPLEVIRRIEAQREEHKKSWERSASALGHRPRASTSLSSLRDAPRTAPIDRIKTVSHLRTTDTKTPLQLGPEGTTEHGRLLYEAARSLELKVRDSSLARTIHTAATSTETTNGAIRAALDLASRIDADPAHRQALTRVLRESLRASDENVRSLTRLMLDMPKNWGVSVPPTPRYDRPETPVRRVYETPVRKSVDLPRPSTALADYAGSRRVRESLPASFSMDLGRPTGSSGSGLRQAMRHSLFTVRSQSPTAPPKQSSSHSNHTVRASNPFLPSSAGKVATTAVSNVTAGNTDGSSQTPSPERESWEGTLDEDGSEEEDVLNTLVAAQRRREEEEAEGGAGAGHVSNHAAMEWHEDDQLALPATVPENPPLDIFPVDGPSQLNPSPTTSRVKSFGTLGRSVSVRESSSERKWSVSDRFMATIQRTRDE